MVKSEFMDSVFEIADIWTEDIDADQYTDFLKKLYARITIHREKGPQKTWAKLRNVVKTGVLGVPAGLPSPVATKTPKKGKPGIPIEEGAALDLGGVADGADDDEDEPESTQLFDGVDLSKMSLRDQAAYMLRQQQKAAGGGSEAKEESEEDEPEDMHIEEVEDEKESRVHKKAKSPEQTNRALEEDRTANQQRQQLSPDQQQRQLSPKHQQRRQLSPQSKTKPLDEPGTKKTRESSTPSNQERVKERSRERSDAAGRIGSQKRTNGGAAKQRGRGASDAGSVKSSKSSDSRNGSSLKRVTSRRKNPPTSSVSSKVRKGVDKTHKTADPVAKRRGATRNARSSNASGYSFKDDESFSGWDNGDESPGTLKNGSSSPATSSNRPAKAKFAKEKSSTKQGTVSKHTPSTSRARIAPRSRRQEGKRASASKAIQHEGRVRSPVPTDDPAESWLSQVEQAPNQRKSSTAPDEPSDPLQRFACPPMLMHYAHCPGDIGSVGKGHPMLWLVKEVNSSPNMNKERLSMKNRLLSDKARHVTPDAIVKRKERQDNTRSRQDADIERLFIRVDSQLMDTVDGGRSLPNLGDRSPTSMHAMTSSTPTGTSSGFAPFASVTAVSPSKSLGTRSLTLMRGFGTM
jgi:hypothetical protein